MCVGKDGIAGKGERERKYFETVCLTNYPPPLHLTEIDT
jgi:hypothetical protein